ncbi:hypothetical protein [Fervidibacter sacchari]|uniref:Uncharacterized protein n=1 Tax=Candidatus Fervidibacter sacchari TaxID=1448929 RepID=A0ABT2ERX0_9BACT|nr:hypothetical protein [Candidatus Fervidibacter sacchari]MCS3920705.1 hypothetical protein [Candidatus Fervidibacter sacchari]WKU16324.1 hypothetical protein Q2T83_00450 [Candidatus Fervidibacter sacchari]
MDNKNFSAVREHCLSRNYSPFAVFPDFPICPSHDLPKFGLSFHHLLFAIRCLFRPMTIVPLKVAEISLSPRWLVIITD